ncbi:hypothetical protein FIBSPDRAFT_737788 [Athelia psychrophila]|uniref:Uncharacterized protein n=1 Tax=Athelia psychrophila TaxID=1759441 RepID=A0A166LQG7_9AGAM|nr:hypothetical protein FIBSPDRAFT_737788 [Fibularhizoctonia sp. CBS 109695]
MLTILVYSRGTDPLIHYGRHFGRTVHTLCTISAIMTNGLLRLADDSNTPDEEYPPEDRRCFAVFCSLVELIPDLKRRLSEGSAEDALHIGTLVRKGIAASRSDDTRGLKGAILDWIIPRGEVLTPPLYRNVKHDRGFHHDRTGFLLCPAEYDWSNTEIKEKLRSGELAFSGDLWPNFVYHGYKSDAVDPWTGLFRSSLLITAYKFVFTSPSSVEKESKATRSGNARIHGMTEVTLPSIAYIATQVRFALSSSAIFTRNDTNTDSERFYHSILDLFEDLEEQKEVNELKQWWDRQIFPAKSSAGLLPQNGTLAKIKERRKMLQARSLNAQNSY